MTSDEKNILDALGIDDLLPEEQEEMLLELGDLVFRNSLVRLIERMDDATKSDFNLLLDTDPSEEVVMAFLKERIPDADKTVQEAVADLRSDILAVTG
jgi:hypothetical protein